MTDDLAQAEVHCVFYKNWAEYAGKITEREIIAAQRGLSRLLGTEHFGGKHFLDVGCGSELHSLTALRLHAAEVIAIDLNPAVHGAFGIVYSWGVLHHAGDMERATRRGAQIVAPGGLFVLPLYRRTWID